MAQALSQSSARILILERGDFVPQESENWDPDAVWKKLRYRAKERWVDDRGREFTPYTHYGVGGNTKFWGSVLYRLRRKTSRRSSTSTAYPRPGRSTTTRSNRTTSVPSACTTCAEKKGSTRPNRRAAPIRTTLSRTRRKWRRSSGSCSSRGCIRRRCRSGC